MDKYAVNIDMEYNILCFAAAEGRSNFMALYLP